MNITDVTRRADTGLCSFRLHGLTKGKLYHVHVTRRDLEDAVFDLRASGGPEMLTFENPTGLGVWVRVFKSRTLTTPGSDEVMREELVF